MELLKTLSLFGLTFALAACSSGTADTTEETTDTDMETAETTESTADSTEAQEILIGISPDYPPYESKDTSGDIMGFDVDMTEWIFNWLNDNGHKYTYDYEELSFDTIISALQAGQIDLGISGFTYDPEREGIFSDSYYDSAQVIVVPASSTAESAADLAGGTIGAQQGTTGEDAAALIEDAQVMAQQDAQVMMETLAADGLDAVVIDKAVAENYVKNGDFKILPDELLVEENVIYSTEEHKELMDQINEAIAAFKESPEYDELIAKWFE